MFNSIGTKKYGIFQKILNSTHPQGQVANMFAKRLSRKGYKTNTYYRDFEDGRFALSASDKLGNTKTYLVSPEKYYVKTNTLKKENNGSIRTIDKAAFNTYDKEIGGETIDITIENNKIIDRKKTKRGWFAVINKWLG